MAKKPTKQTRVRGKFASKDSAEWAKKEAAAQKKERVKYKAHTPTRIAKEKRKLADTAAKNKRVAFQQAEFWRRRTKKTDYTTTLTTERGAKYRKRVRKVNITVNAPTRRKAWERVRKIVLSIPKGEKVWINVRGTGRGVQPSVGSRIGTAQNALVYTEGLARTYAMTMGTTVTIEIVQLKKLKKGRK